MNSNTTQGLVRFCVPEVAESLGIEPRTLTFAMFEATACLLVIEAWQLLELTMQEQGLRPGIDPYPHDWPNAYLASVATERLSLGQHQPDLPTVTLEPGHA